MIVDDDIRALVTQNTDAEDASSSTAVADGMRTLREDGARKVLRRRHLHRGGAARDRGAKASVAQI